MGSVKKKRKADSYMLAEIAVSYEPTYHMNSRPKIKDQDVVVEVMRNVWKDIRVVESVWIIALNRANNVLGVRELSKGGLHGSVIDPKILFPILLKGLACGFIIVHNHPSGNVSPSEADTKICKKLQEGAEMLELSLVDFIILGPDNQAYSFAAANLL